MDYKKLKVEPTTVTRKIRELDAKTGNIYETVCILSKRANQIGLELKEELNQKLSEFAPASDNLEEIFENREQIEIAKYYEQLPKPSLISISEYMADQVYARNPSQDEK